MYRGYIKLWRKLQDSFIYKDSQAVHLWIHLLLEANHKDREFMFNGKKMICRRGQVITGLNSLAKKTRISKSKVYRLLKTLENETLIETQKTNRFTLVSIVCYNSYQSDETLNEKQVKLQRNSSETPVKTNNNVKNDNNVKRGNKFTKPTLKEITSFINEFQLNVCGETFIDHYESNGWTVGKSKMKDWKATLRNWNRRSCGQVKKERAKV